MSTINQVYNGCRKPKRKEKIGPTYGRPQISGIVKKVLILSPKKPNSAFRKACVMKIKTSRKLYKECKVYIPGMGHQVKEHSKALLRGGRRKDTPGVRRIMVRGTLDASGVENRKNGRSKYGTPKPKD